MAFSLNSLSDYQVSDGGRRCLMLLSKVLQNLANGVQFREDYMGHMNATFLTDHIPVIQEFFDLLSVRWPPCREQYLTWE